MKENFPRSLSECIMFFSPQCSIEEKDNQYHVNGGQIAYSFLPKSSDTLELIRGLENEGIREKDLSSSENTLGKNVISEVKSFLDVFKQNCYVRYGIEKGNETIAYLEPLSIDYEFVLAKIKRDEELVWSRFALLRQLNGGWIIESPLSQIRIELHDELFWKIIHLLGKPNTIINIASTLDIDLNYVEYIISVLAGANILNQCKDPDFISKDKPLDHWDFHDLYFHTRSRRGRNNSPMGGNYRFEGVSEPPPVTKKVFDGPQIELPHIDVNAMMYRDPSFTQVLEGRQSIRMAGTSVISIYQLSEFLFRSARVRMLHPPNSPMQLSSRPYPNGGASYELELYLIINRCSGINPGFYHYCPLNHRLTFISALNDSTNEMLKSAAWASAQYVAPAIHFTIAARFQRVSWKYQGIAYAIILKNTGVLYQTLYLVATAMGLQPCGIGLGDSDRFSKLAKVNYLEESSVGEFILG